MGNDIVMRVLRLIASSNHGLDSNLKNSMGIDEVLLQSIMGFLIAEGFIMEIKPTTCQKCPLSNTCSLGKSVARKPSALTIYVLTEKGKRLLKDKKENSPTCLKKI